MAIGPSLGAPGWSESARIFGPGLAGAGGVGTVGVDVALAHWHCRWREFGFGCGDVGCRSGGGLAAGTAGRLRVDVTGFDRRHTVAEPSGPGACPGPDPAQHVTGLCAAG